MGRKKLADDVPCPQGHTEGRNDRGQCVACRKLRKKKENRARTQRRANARRRDWLAALNRLTRKWYPPKASEAELRARWLRQNGRCGLTGAIIPEGMRPQLDHIVPKCAGGSNTIENLQWVHPMANHAKNKYSVAEFRAWLLAAADALRHKMQLEELL